MFLFFSSLLYMLRANPKKPMNTLYLSIHLLVKKSSIIKSYIVIATHNTISYIAWFPNIVQLYYVWRDVGDDSNMFCLNQCKWL